ncbi:mRNA cap guanine-N7 methyltransferase 2 [Vitis vinifera]|uniref:mRNA cap guanine-N(7) methyltransferase 2 n=1 Tax=Vitis vinifera TaxID=29760 RepID=A0A438CYT9_VITVI|nr:mRNA cap guanine-N7 methyltransferase 2 [Vitis vinifera]
MGNGRRRRMGVMVPARLKRGPISSTFWRLGFSLHTPSRPDWEATARPTMTSIPAPRTAESTHHRLFEFAKTALIKIFVSPYATVCDLYAGAGSDADKWDEAQIGHYIGIDVSSSGISHTKEVWESQRKSYNADFYELDPSMENLELNLQDKCNTADVVCCLQHLQLGFENEDKGRRLLHNVASLLKPGGYFLALHLTHLPYVTSSLDSELQDCRSSVKWAKYQKNVEAYHNRGSSMKPNIVPNCIRSESYMITFEVEEEKFPFFGKKYQLKFSNDTSAETYCLVHFPSLIRLAREAGLEYVEIQNLTDFYDDNRILQPSVHSFVHSIWKAIKNGWEVFKVRTHFKVGSRNMVKFWKDRWCGDELLRDAFPNHFSIASSKDARVADAWDGVEWVDTKSGIFSVKSFYSSLASKGADPFPHDTAWNSWAPVGVHFFAWEATWGKILTLDQLKKRGWKLPKRCYMCKEEEETIGDALFSKRFTLELGRLSCWAQFAGMLLNSGPNLVDPRGRLLPRSYDVLGLYTTFIFQKVDPDIVPPLTSPFIIKDGSHNYEEASVCDCSKRAKFK